MEISTSPKKIYYIKLQSNSNNWCKFQIDPGQGSLLNGQLKILVMVQKENCIETPICCTYPCKFKEIKDSFEDHFGNFTLKKSTEKRNSFLTFISGFILRRGTLLWTHSATISAQKSHI